MKKSSFTALVSGTVSGTFFAIGMCMAMLPQWNAFQPGCVMGIIGIILGLASVANWRRMEHKEPIKFSGKLVGTVLLGITGALILGIGMCLTMVWTYLIPGIVLGVIGILLLLCMIPLCVGIR